MGVRGPACPGNDGESYQTPPEVIVTFFVTNSFDIRLNPNLLTRTLLYVWWSQITQRWCRFVSRNLFFRVSSLTLMGVKLVFVMEGEAPKLKAETMSKRTETRYGGFKKASAHKSTTNTSRGRFKAVLREVGWSSTVLHLSSFSVIIHSCSFWARLCLSCLHSVQICWTFWVCRGWLLLGRLRPCVPIWTHRAWWTAASLMMETHFCTEPRLSTGTSTWIVKYVSGRSSHLQRAKSLFNTQYYIYFKKYQWNLFNLAC